MIHPGPLNFSAEELRTETLARVGKMSLPGIQPKLSAILKNNSFELVEQYGRYILKPQSEHYPELPENEAFTMSLAATIGIDIPEHGLVSSKDHNMTYFIKRFDHKGKNEKLAVEDFAQLLQLSRDTKYNSSMEQVAKVLFDFCSFPKVEAVKLAKLVLFNFLTGNEDAHLKNFSLITYDQKVQLSPAYDLLNTTIVQPFTKEEMALPLNDKKNNLKRQDFLSYFSETLQLNDKIIAALMQEIMDAIPRWQQAIKSSVLSTSMQEKYLLLLEKRSRRLI